MRLLCTLVLLLLSSIIYGQNSTLFQNVNSRAKELKHNLNKTGDTLILSCKRTIFEVVIYNDEFERVVGVREIDAQIPIADIPVGRYIIETLLSDKLIVITLLRNESFQLPKSIQLITDNTNENQENVLALTEVPKREDEQIVVTESTVVAKVVAETVLPETVLPEKVVVKKIVEEKVVAVPEPKKTPVSKEIYIKNTDLAVAGKKAKPKPKEVKKHKPKPQVKRVRAKEIIATYWVVYQINTGTSSERIQKMADQKTVDRMIRKIKVDMKSIAGRRNELSVWLVYNPSEFIQHKKYNKTDYMNVASESFNMKPYFIIENKAE